MTTPTPTRLTARCTDDLLAMVPVALGFTPEDSLVLLTFAADRPFHARVDLPDAPDHDEQLVEMLLAPARHHHVRRAAVLAYARPPRADDAHRVGRRLVGALRAAGIDVVDAVRADGERWHALLEPADPGVPYDVSTHRFTAQAVLDGRPLLGSRGELAGSLEPCAAAVARTAAVARFVKEGPGRLSAAGVADAVEEHLAAGRLPDDVLVEVLRAIRAPGVRDGAWTTIRRATATDHVRLWTDAVRRAPEQLRGSAAAVLAFAAWMAGDGALAWCAIDRCLAVDPANSLADLVAEGLQRAVSPHVFEESGLTSRGGWE
jgi:hypothetical protein